MFGMAYAISEYGYQLLVCPSFSRAVRAVILEKEGLMMKFYSKLLTAVMAVAFGSAIASADTIVLGSYGTLNGSGGVMPAPLPNNTPVMYNNGKGLSSVYNIGSDGASVWPP